MKFKLLIILSIILVIILIVINIDIPWTGDLSWKLSNLIKNCYIKFLKHSILKIPLNKKICKENLETIARILNNLGIVFWLSEGTALGARRDGTFIAHDDDVDIGIWVEDYTKFKKQALHLLKEEKFTLDGCRFRCGFLAISRNGEKIDIDFTGKGIKCMACRTKNARCKLCDPMLPYLENMSYINFMGNVYLCPGIDYLEYLYGKTWNIPLKEKFTLNEFLVSPKDS